MTSQTLVIHFNAFTGQIEGGYFMGRNRKRVGDMMSAHDVLIYLTKNPAIRCSPLKV